MTKEDILRVVEDRLRELGISASAASKSAVGNQSFIANLRRERYGMPSIENLEKLAEVLKLELYFGPPRDSADPIETGIDDATFVQIPLHAATLAAGGGREGSEDVLDYLSFRRDWLRRIGVAPTSAILAKVEKGEAGESMVPTIHPGDTLLIDTAKTNVPRAVPKAMRRKPPIYAIRTEFGARVKRVETLEEKLVALLSDNPDYPPEFLRLDTFRDMGVIGKVIWWGHTALE